MCLLQVACRINRADILKLLIDLGHPNLVDICKHNRYSAMHTAAEEGSVECLRLLLTHGAPDRPRESKGLIPFELAKDKNRENVVKFLSMSRGCSNYGRVNTSL